jgi:hypothetical protein
MNVFVQAAVLPAASAPGGQGWRQAGELGVALINEATQRGYRIDALSPDPAADRPAVAGPRDDGKPAMTAVTLRLRGRRPISELTDALTNIELVDAVVTADYPAPDE